MSNALTIYPTNTSLTPGGSIEAYLATISGLRTLNQEEERALAIRFRDHNDLEAARQLVLSGLRFVAHIARGYLGYGLPLADLIQEGNVGLMKAVKKFDPDAGVRLISFAVHWIKAEITDFIVNNFHLVKIATTKAQRKLFFNLRKLKPNANRLTADEAQFIANELDVSLRDVYEMEARLSGGEVSIEHHPDYADSEETSAPIDYLTHGHGDPLSIIEEEDWSTRQRAGLAMAVEQLDDRSRDIIQSRWLSQDKITLNELAERYGLTAERVRQIESTALKSIRKSINLEEA
jgi:RNA polymerase sigma-32 factor